MIRRNSQIGSSYFMRSCRCFAKSRVYARGGPDYSSQSLLHIPFSVPTTPSHSAGSGHFFSNHAVKSIRIASTSRIASSFRQARAGLSSMAVTFLTSLWVRNIMKEKGVSPKTTVRTRSTRRQPSMLTHDESVANKRLLDPLPNHHSSIIA